jgi:hypothetical protein
MSGEKRVTEAEFASALSQAVGKLQAAKMPVDDEAAVLSRWRTVNAAETPAAPARGGSRARKS